jgi:uncharacterized protein YuzE
MISRDTRKQERTSIQTSARIETDNAGDCILMDFSENGLGFLLNLEKVHIGQKLCVNLETAPKSTSAQGVVKWSRKLKEGNLFNYAVGVELVYFDMENYLNLLQHSQS